MRWLIPLCSLLSLIAPRLQAQEAPPALTTAVQKYSEIRGNYEPQPFQHALTDLNGDGLADAIVLLQSRKWCGSGGCNMLIFRGTAEGFTLVSVSTVTSTPLRVLTDKTAGWNTLIVHSRGRGEVLMRFDGSRYPPNPSIQPKASPEQIAAATLALE